MILISVTDINYTIKLVSKPIADPLCLKMIALK